jgi:hydroxymethylglutaryl-CoA reductase
MSVNVDSVDPFGHPRIPYRGHYDRVHCDKRRSWLERFGGCSLEHCGQWWLSEGSSDACSCIKLKGNIENAIGLAKVPLGVCGPLLFTGDGD